MQSIGPATQHPTVSSDEPDENRRRLQAMRRITEPRPRFGCERVHPMLNRSGWAAGFGRVHRLWKQQHMQVPATQHKRRRLPGHGGNGCVRRRATHRNHVCTYDFLTEQTEGGGQFKLLVVLDEFTREALAIEVGRSFTARGLILTLQFLLCSAWSTAADSIRQWPGVHRQEYPALSGTGSSEHTLPQQGRPLTKCLRGIVQRQAS